MTAIKEPEDRTEDITPEKEVYWVVHSVPAAITVVTMLFNGDKFKMLGVGIGDPDAKPGHIPWTFSAIDAMAVEKGKEVIICGCFVRDHMRAVEKEV